MLGVNVRGVVAFLDEGVRGRQVINLGALNKDALGDLELQGPVELDMATSLCGGYQIEMGVMLISLAVLPRF